MIRGTTPTITISTDIDLSDASNLFVTFVQNSKVVFEKTLDDVTVTENAITVPLSQTDTLSLRADQRVRFQIRATKGGSKLASNIMTTTAGEILKNGEI